MKIILIVICIYAVSAFGMYQWVKTSYSKGGRWEHSNPDNGDLVWTFVPIANTIAATIGWAFYPPKKKTPNNYNGFFNIKK